MAEQLGQMRARLAQAIAPRLVALLARRRRLTEGLEHREQHVAVAAHAAERDLADTPEHALEAGHAHRVKHGRRQAERDELWALQLHAFVEEAVLPV